MTDLTRRHFLGAPLPLLAALPIASERAGRRYTQAELWEAAASHARWLRDEPGGVYADFRQADLAGLDFADLDLSYADLSGANLAGIKAPRLQAEHALFVAADLTNAVIAGAQLDCAVFDWASLRSAQIVDWLGPTAHPRHNVSADWNTSLIGARFHNADLTGARIGGYLSGTSLIQATLSNTDFSSGYGCLTIACGTAAQSCRVGSALKIRSLGAGAN